MLDGSLYRVAGSLPRAGILHTCPFVPGWLLQLQERSPQRQLGLGWSAHLSPGAVSWPA